MITVKQLTKTFGSFTAVNNLSFDVKPGEVLGFLGPNGAGKSTTMKMITGFLAPTAGTVEVDGHDISKDTLAAQKLIGYLPEGAPSYGEMTVEAFLKFIAEVRGFTGSEAQTRIEKVINEVELGSVRNQPIENLSKGFKRRVGLAQAILHDPKILILDEPTDGLDPNQKQHVRELIENLSKDKIVIVSTHILEEVTAVCSRAMIIANGAKVADGTPAELQAMSKYHNAISLRFAEEVNSDVLASINGVKEVLREGDWITLIPEQTSGLLDAVNAALDEKGLHAEEIFVERGRLDDVFRSVTREGAK
ncbi:ABC transporter ATP-binding protein [Litoribrevibacter albus]|uniref:ABC transporter ATP-binding protein n=1 Tax=Litoribrevibacter albus TaxID=1473156 RepID=A0AA37S8W1_9GAMM|nr:ABC transporter ATP-binding protein [Litoribrevibacter albus]GLQ31215.1 ABC transporter ATP-binding protein [Litoribrevibacter albus]